MPWNIIIIPSIICLILGFMNGLKTKNKRHVK
ncbi:MAG: hypothetical protein RLZZ28_1872 [Bacteroidota bacterium]